VVSVWVRFGLMFRLWVGSSTGKHISAMVISGEASVRGLVMVSSTPNDYFSLSCTVVDKLDDLVGHLPSRCNLDTSC